MKYLVAKANETARAFVAKLDKEQPGWIILYRTNDYYIACTQRDLYNHLSKAVIA
jgi:hypothetical protein